MFDPYSRPLERFLLQLDSTGVRKNITVSWVMEIVGSILRTTKFLGRVGTNICVAADMRATNYDVGPVVMRRSAFYDSTIVMP